MDDLISRQAAIDRINKQREHLQPDVYPQDEIGDAAYRICAELIERLSSAQPERKTGRWILWNYPGEECAICSACGEEYDQMELYIGGNDYPKYCPNCGAKMEVEE